MGMEIVELDELTMVGDPVRAGWRELWVEMPKAWQHFIARHHEIEVRNGVTFADVSLEKVDDAYLQLISARVSRVQRIPDGMRAVEIPAQPFIHFKHVGPVTEIAASFGKMYEWARENGHAAGDFKVDFGYTAEGDERAHDLYVALLPQKPWREIA